MFSFQVVTWDTRDRDGHHEITMFGRADDGRSVSLTTKFQPYFMIKCPIEIPHPLINGSCTSILTGYKDLWGFQNGREHRFIKYSFPSLEAWSEGKRVAMKWSNKQFGPKRSHVYEANIDPVLRFMHRSGIQSTGWVVPGTGAYPWHGMTTDICLMNPDWRDIKPIVREDIAPLKVASFDIETYSSEGGFPDPSIEGDCVFQVAFTWSTIGSKDIESVCLCLGETNTTKTNVRCFSTEGELLEAISTVITEQDFDILTGWNIFGFDMPYLMKRAIMNKAFGFQQLGRISNTPSDIVTKKLSSGALGNNVFHIIPMPGRFVFDLMQDVKREKNLESYSLNHVSQTFLKESKDDVSPGEMFDAFRSRDPTRLGVVADYCVQDTALPLKLMSKLCTLTNLLEMAKATWVPISYLSERGQQIKVFSQMCRKSREMGYLVPTVNSWALKNDEKYQGATVLDADTGAHYTPIVALDFASLYPSIMMAHNLCYSTLVLDPKYKDLPGVKYEEFGGHVFAQSEVGVLPTILKELKAFRKQAKRDMADAEGTPMEAVYDSKQLAYKISMNSAYGFCGAGKGMLPCVPIASTVTLRGRQMIEESKRYVEENFPGAVVRYGDTDSIMVDFGTPATQEGLEQSWRLGERAAKEITGLFKSPNNLELEKVFYPFILYSKKRYAAKMWVGDDDANMTMKKIDVKGLQAVRRDSAPFIRNTLKDLLALMLESRDPKPVMELAKAREKLLRNGDVPTSDLILSKKLAGSYKNPGSMAHVAVVNKMRERAPGSEPRSGDRVQFVIIDNGSKRMFEKSEDPTFALENGIGLDYEYYFTNQFVKPVSDLLEPLCDTKSLFCTKRPKKQATQ